MTSFLSLVPTLDGYTDHVNSQTIDLYLDGESPKLNFRVDKNKWEFQAIELFPLESLCYVSMRNVVLNLEYISRIAIYTLIVSL